MGLLRLIIIGVLVWLAISLIRRQLARRDRTDALPPRSGTMVRCEQCGMHVPESEAVHRDGHVYCPEHGEKTHL